VTGIESSKVRTGDYPLGGQLLLWAARHWVRSYRRGTMVPPCVRQSFAAADLGRAYASLCHLMRIVTFRELTVTAVRSPGAARLSGAERDLMSLFETIERDGPAATQAVAETFATPAVAREIVATAVEIVRELGKHGHHVGAPEAGRQPVLPSSPRHAQLAVQH